MQISLNGIAFTSYDVKVKNNSKEEFKNEVVSFNENMDKTNQNTNELSKNTTSTIFKDPTNEKLVTVSLENSTIEKLQNQFGKNSIIKNENGSVTLNEKAQNFVAGWFADIAYVRDYLKADTDSDGILNEEEYKNTKNGVQINSNITFDKNDFIVKEEITDSYLKTDELLFNVYRTEKKEGSLDEELNHTLNIDKNFDGNITLQEAYEGESTVDKKIQENLRKLFLDTNPFEEKGYFKEYFTQALNYVLETMEKSETLDKDKWEQIRKDHYLKLDDGYLRLDLELISTLDSGLIEKLLKKLKENSSLIEQNNLKISETTEEFLNRINTNNKEIEIYV